MEPTLSIGQLALATGLAAKTIRYYEQMGVLPAPRRTAAGYRQYARRDVHRTLFIRRARALGFPLGRLKALTADLDGRPSRRVRPRLQRLVMEHLHALRQQIADLRVLEQQLEQVSQRLRTSRSVKHSEACDCLDSAAPPTFPPLPARSPARPRGGAGANGDPTMEAITRLAGAGNGDCDCGCGCPRFGAASAKQPERPRLPLLARGPTERDLPAGSRADKAVGSRVRRR